MVVIIHEVSDLNHIKWRYESNNKSNELNVSFEFKILYFTQVVLIYDKKICLKKHS